MSEAPRECPCCNSQAFALGATTGYCVECCRCGLKSRECETSEVAVRVWNRRFDGQYGITARELEAQVVTEARGWFEHHSIEMPSSLKSPKKHPLTQVVTSSLWSVLHRPQD